MTLMTRKEAAARLGMSLPTLDQERSTGRLAYIQRKADDPVDDAEELAEARAAAAQPEWEQQQFTPIDGEDEELPF